MNCTLRYGRNSLNFEIPDGISPRIFRTRPMPLLENPNESIRQALADPIGALPLEQLAKGKRNACIVISDITRPAPNKVVLPPILEVLDRTGIRPKDIRILVATGIHRAPTAGELVEMLGREILSRHTVLSHNARDRSAIQRIGFTHSGIPIDINRMYLESELKMITGLVEPHFMAGFSGGRKSIAVGLTSVDAITWLHGPRILEDPRARNCLLDGNPLHRELLEIADAARADMSVNVVLDGDRSIAYVSAGDLRGSHLAACDFARQYLAETGSGLFDIIITSSAGYPLDTTFYQAVKGLVGVLDILAPGGSIILAAQCLCGLGSREFQAGLKLLASLEDHDRFLEYIAQPDHFCIDQWEVEMLVKALRKAKIYLFSEGLTQNAFPLTGSTRIESIEEGIKRALANAGPHAALAVVPEGPYFVPLSGSSV